MCVAGGPIVCDDGIACTIDSCDAELGGCAHVPDHARCAAFETCDVDEGCRHDCVPTNCQGKVYECSDCIDNDGDGMIDMQDPECWGPCDNNEMGWKAEIPGSGPWPCFKVDCYFDQDTGSGNDDCHWSHACDPLEPSMCTHNPDMNVPGTTSSCAVLEVEQSDLCHDFCGPLTPNGCDCFGCCDVHLDGGVVTVYLGTEERWGDGTCNLANADDPTKCHPCTQVEACSNPCDTCELCLGKSTLPDGCSPQDQCPGGEDPCGLPGQSACPLGFFCSTGCCQPNPP
jgi:hypothetical protein